MENILEVKNLCKDYKNFKLDNISFNIPSGKIIGLIGENGAGKSTTINTLLDLTKKTNGKVLLLNEEYNLSKKDLRNNIGIVFDEINFYKELNIKKIEKISQKTYSSWDSNLFFSYIDKFNLPIDKEIKSFSKGMKMKLSIAIALSHDAKLLILDEATTGLDPVMRDDILEVFLDFVKDGKHSILISSHITTDLEKVADDILFIHKGKSIFCMPKDTLYDNFGIIRCDKEFFKTIDKED